MMAIPALKGFGVAVAYPDKKILEEFKKLWLNNRIILKTLRI
ncbi:MAG: hypothetical protein Ct9H300mP28_36640 [Pseudomonadota bacterium]|nr:MAG: hypothetical protein Ct9H300mP28_36640 [Pseudomonadota bacterium]